jgi:acyl homoserine lactone synthase
MLHYSTGTREQLPPQLFEQMGKYRRAVFIERLGWGLHAVGGMELDEFDGPDAVYVCSHDDEGSVNGVARLLPTTGPYLLEKVFPHLWAGQAPPKDLGVWELSRFATAASDDALRPSSQQVDAKTASNLLRQVIQVANANGANSLITVSPIAMERLLRVNGFRVSRAGLPMIIDGGWVVALWLGIKTDL